jgi:hypothetical protein
VAILRQLAAAGTEVRLVDCAGEGAIGEGSSGNLTIERLGMVGGVPAAGVVVPLEVKRPMPACTVTS